MSNTRTTKTCPDCAEEVLAAARKCRFCGYRFAPPPASSGGGGLLDMLRVKPPSVEKMADLVDEWGIELWPDEVVPDDGLCFAQVEGVTGYVLVTSSRVRFVVPRKGKTDVRLNRELRLLRGATVERRRLRRVAVLRFDDAEYVVHVETGDPEQLVSRLTV